MAKALGICARSGWAPFAVHPAHVQPGQAPGRGRDPADGAKRRPGRDHLQPAGRRPAHRQVRPRHAPRSRPPGGEHAYQKRYDDDWIYPTAARFRDFARQRGYNPAALAVAWVGSHPAVTAPIIGARSLAQLEDSLAALDLAMTPELRTEISALSLEPAVATDRSEERA